MTVKLQMNDGQEITLEEVKKLSILEDSHESTHYSVIDVCRATDEILGECPV